MIELSVNGQTSETDREVQLIKEPGILTMISNKDFYNPISNENFDSVYKFIEMQIKEESAQFFSYKDYELHLNDDLEIIIKKNAYTLSKISRGNGIFSLVKTEKENKEMVVKTDKLFLEVLALSNKNFNNQ